MPIISGGSGGGSGAVSSVFTRVGAVAATSGDYTAAQVTNAADKSSGSQQAFTAELAAPDFTPSGLTGATSASRYAGATASGSPGSGTFVTGDWVIAQNGHIFVCTAGGTPGTWVDVGSVANQVTSVFGRTGAVVATSGDYTAAQVTNAADKSSSTLQAFAAGLSSAHATQGIGYATGAGGTVTQTTTRSTAVTINKVTGKIQTDISSLASGASVEFVVNNSTVAATDAIVVVMTNGSSLIQYWVDVVAAGSFRITYINNAGTSTSTAFIFTFFVLKAVTA